MRSFAHFILTRFNVRFGALPPGPEWLRHRLDLFSRFCFPSVMAQTNRHFRWLIFVDPETPADVLAELRALGGGDVVSYRPLPAFDARLAAASVRADLPGGVEHVITTTLDNDDALARTFVDEVQSLFRGQSFELVNLRGGFRLMLATGKLYEVDLPGNPFVTLIERAHSPTTIWGCLPHSTLLRRFQVTDVPGGRFWLQVAHDRNLALVGPWGRRRVSTGLLEQHFTLRYEPALDDDRRPGFRIENVRRWLERRLINLMNDDTRSRMRLYLRRVRRGSR